MQSGLLPEAEEARLLQSSLEQGMGATVGLAVGGGIFVLQFGPVYPLEQLHLQEFGYVPEVKPLLH